MCFISDSLMAVLEDHLKTFRSPFFQLTTCTVDSCCAVVAVCLENKGANQKEPKQTTCQVDSFFIKQLCLQLVS